MIVPDHILAMAERMRTDDNLGTSHPAFNIQEYERIYGDDGGDYEWRDEDWNLAGGEEAAALDDYEEQHSEPKTGWTKCHYREGWRTVMCCFSRKGAEDYIACNGHNMRRDGHPARIYVESFWRCQEMIALREWLLTLKADT